VGDPKQRNKAEKKAADRHGGGTSSWSSGGWGPGGHSDGRNTTTKKLYKSVVNRAKRAIRRAGKEIIKEELMTEYMEEPRNPGLDDGRCALCKKPGLDEDSRCFGCGYLICEDHYGDPDGKHLVVDHDEE